jgi:uncharacterized repeat protein (TIGR03806 family)
MDPPFFFQDTCKQRELEVCFRQQCAGIEDFWWNCQITAISLELVSDRGRMPFTYLVPDVNQCAGCHAVDHDKQVLKPIGPKARHLNKDYQYPEMKENQLSHWRRAGLLTGVPADPPRHAQWDVAATGDLNERARAYRDVNCSHCHSPLGAANTSGLLLHAREADPAKLGVCKIPIATGRGSGSALFDIVPGAPDQSIFLHRMASSEPDVAMPELGRSLIHEEGLALIREWIASMPGGCISGSRQRLAVSEGENPERGRDAA